MVYKVVKYFTDLQDSDHPYSVGDTFPREGVAVSESRLAELAGRHNRQGVPLIVAVAEEAAPKKAAKRGRKAAEK